jgi:cytochrome b pre-mRNA-processing protein 3
MGQALFDRFCEDMDYNLREIGVGDLSVPKQMQHIGEAFYGRAQAYRSALASDGAEALVAVLARNVFGGAAPEPAAPVRLAAYIQEAVRGLGTQQPADLLAGKLRMPDPGR